MNNEGANYINNNWVEGSGETFTSINPADNTQIWEGKAADESEVNAAVAAARAATQPWAETPVKTRIGYLENYYDILKNHADQLAEIISQETGKPLWESKTEVQSMIGKIPISFKAYNDRCKERKTQLPNALSQCRHKPHGVCAVFGPYNFPAHLPNGHIVPALLAGNTIVFKPSNYTPLVAEQIINLWELCDLPKGVLNLIQGGKTVGRKLGRHQDIDGIFFTGSWPTGKSISKYLGSYPNKILALEMGGNNPLIVSDISDLKAAAYLTVQSAYLTSGQRCTCARRLIVLEGKQGDAFLAELINMIQTIKVGPYTDTPEPFMGPVINPTTAHQLLAEQSNLLWEGAYPLLTMQHLEEDTAWISPGILDVTNSESRSDDEIFGPLLQLIRVPNFNAAIEEANNTAYGLSAGILTDNPKEYEEFFRRARAGIINWNTQLTGASSAMPFGGIGQSGNHRPSGFYAADYCSYPVASMETPELRMPEGRTPGIGEG